MCCPQGKKGWSVTWKEGHECPFFCIACMFHLSKNKTIKRSAYRYTPHKYVNDDYLEKDSATTSWLEEDACCIFFNSLENDITKNTYITKVISMTVDQAITRFRAGRGTRHACECSRTIDPKNRHVHDYLQHAYIWAN